MTIDIYDEKPQVLKKKLAQFYNVKIKKDQRLMIPGRDDVIFVNVYYERDKHASLIRILNDIARYYWSDRIKFKYEGLSEELIADRWKALSKARQKVKMICETKS